MSLRLRPMTEVEMSSFVRAGVGFYVAQRSANTGEPEEAVRRDAQEKYATYFPGGRPAPRHELMVLEDGGERIATVWVGPHPKRPEAAHAAWLYEIEVERRFRGRGYGRCCLELVETHLAEQGVTELVLNVFGDNAVARSLYTTAGWRETAVTMSKTLSAPRS